ncbi:MAG: hypothetical protein JWP84_2573 [Tardiphaga sp.]|jgi:hypothetical protein|nr:hypothetical protein [Tardiphaga sp.]
MMVETRRATRHRARMAATIAFGGTAIDCTVRDLSTTGGAIEVTNQIDIPEEFTLIVPDHALRLPCHVVWRSGFRIGVRFD